MTEQVIQTPITQLFGIKHPIILAGMGGAAGPELAAAVTNAGGLGVIGGVGYTYDQLRDRLDELKEGLIDKNAPFGVDLLLPKVGDGARATNKDYTNGKLPQLVDLIIEKGAKLFVCAVGVPPKWLVEKFHAAKIPVMNMVGAPKHVNYALEQGVDIICAQGGEGGGHTGEVATSVLVPAVFDMLQGKKSPLTGEQIHMVAAGGISDGRGLAMAMSLGASAVWVGSRFVASDEAGAGPFHKRELVRINHHETQRTLIFSGRPMRVIKNDYVRNWEENRTVEMNKLLKEGTVPAFADNKLVKEVLDDGKLEGKGLMAPEDIGKYKKPLRIHFSPLLAGQVSGNIHDILPAKQIVEEMVNGAAETLRAKASLVKGSVGAAASKL